MKIERTTEEKKASILEIIRNVAGRSEFGAADLKALHFQSYRLGIDIDELQQYIAVLKSENKVAGEVVGSNYYIIPKNI